MSDEKLSQVPRNHMVTSEGDYLAFHCFERDDTILIPADDGESVAFCPSCGTRHTRLGAVARTTEWLPSLPKTATIFGTGVAIVMAASRIPVDYGTGTAQIHAVPVAEVGELLALFFVMSLLLAKWTDVIEGHMHGGGV